ncbi:2Fe-2S ferredoxin [Croceibacterium mercuriale]|uniref:2Fe-2S ferredoxin n=1 Tax=Croceibacterium mercuriale TaxID=1572751 RepID=A0A0B2C2F4_9SPHN|nr:2Fe-2S iron-sulfur cluster-binding protein [Croceibacterium mercuriale]KHL26181.1 2Fe-2S ferredoxin [Croceibacterium mercuriale]
MQVQFLARGGERITADARVGDRLLDIAQAAGLPLEGTCEGQMACSTCHLIVAPQWFGRLPPASAEEEDLLDLAPGACSTSRLACQIVLSDGLDGLLTAVP